MKEAAVVGVPDRLRGEVPVAYIVADGTLDAAALEAKCRQKPAAFKVPRGFLAVEQLPRNAMGKLQKHLLPNWETPRFTAAGRISGVAGDTAKCL